MRLPLLATISIGLLSAACQSTQTASVPYRAGANTTVTPISMTSEQACTDYGFVGGTVTYTNCVTRERTYRSYGRVSQDYAEARLTADARGACSSYGLDSGSARYDRCVSREMEARRYYSDGTTQTSANYRVDQYGNRIDSEGYRVDANGYRMQSQTTSAAPYYPATTSQQTYRDEFGNRYDAQGNRIDARGRVIVSNYR